MQFFKKYLFLIPFAFIIVLTLFAYRDLPTTFFQQDEWWAFGKFIARELNGGIRSVILNPLLEAGKIHFNPLANIGFFVEYKLFKLSFSSYAYVSIVIHLANVFLVYYLGRLIIKNKFINFFIALLFALNSTSHQVVSWVASTINTQGMTFFTLLFICFFIKYLKGNSRNKNLLYISYFVAIISILFKETLTPFLILPIVYILYDRDKNFKSVKKIFIPLAIFLGIYFLFRIVIYINAAPVIGGGNMELVQAGIGQYAYRLFLLPFRIVAQSLIPTGILLFLSELVLNLGYPQFTFQGIANPFVRETVSYDLLCFFLGGSLLILSYFAWKHFRKRDNDLAKALVLFFFIAIFNAILLIFIPGSPGYASLIEQRHLYPGIFGSIGILIIVIFFLFSWLKKLAIIPIGFTLTIAALLYVWNINSDIAKLQNISVTRRYIVDTILKSNNNLPGKVVFYIESDTSYNGLSEESLPEQIGVGLILLVSYQDKEKFPACLYDSNVFFQILSQGYKECDGRGFGYFTNYDKLMYAVRKNNLSVDNIISFSWKGKVMEFNNITKLIRIKIGEELVRSK